jgi:hypothetical protein
MRKSISIAVVAVVAIATVWTWTLTNSGANARNKISGAVQHGVNTLDLTMKAGMLPSQQYDAH